MGAILNRAPTDPEAVINRLDAKPTRLPADLPQFSATKCLKVFAKGKRKKEECQKEVEKWNLNPFQLPSDRGLVPAELVTVPRSPSRHCQLPAPLPDHEIDDKWL
jgi:hypothetical protein